MPTAAARAPEIAGPSSDVLLSQSIGASGPILPRPPPRPRLFLCSHENKISELQLPSRLQLRQIIRQRGKVMAYARRLEVLPAPPGQSSSNWPDCSWSCSTRLCSSPMPLARLFHLLFVQSVQVLQQFRWNLCRLECRPPASAAFNSDARSCAACAAVAGSMPSSAACSMALARVSASVKDSGFFLGLLLRLFRQVRIETA